MAHRFLCGFLVAAALAGCSGSGITGTPPSNGAAGGNGTGSTSGQIILQGSPPNSVIVGSAYSFKPLVVSSSGGLTFAIEGQPKWATFDASTGTLSGTPSTGDVGMTGDITITASNGYGTGSMGPFAVRVDLVAQPGGDLPPVISGTPGSTVTALQSYTFQPTASDAAGKPLTFSISNCPTWAIFSTATGILSGTPNAHQTGLYTNIDIFVSDGTVSVALPEFSIAVAASAPDVPSISGTPQTSVEAGEPYSFQPSAADPASKPLTFSISGAPSWGKFDTTTGMLAGTPTATQEGVYSNIIITASNGSSRASLAAFSIHVTAPVSPDSPQISGTPATAVVAGRMYGFQPTAIDPAGKALTFSIANRPYWAAFNSASGHLVGTPSATETGSYPNIIITASNGTESASLPAFSIVVSKAPPPGSPTISGSPATSVVAGNGYSFIPITTDPSGGRLRFSIQNAPHWASFDAATGALSGTPTAGEVGTYSNIVITVSDGMKSASLPAFPISVTQSGSGLATLSWTAPTQNTDGSALTNLAGYTIFYGTGPTAMTKTVRISSPGITTYVITNLSPGMWYFEIRAFNTANVQSDQSAVASKMIM